MVEGDIVSDPVGMYPSNAFTSVYSNSVPTDEAPHHTSDGSISYISFSVHSVELQLRQIKSDSSAGPDGMHPSLFKHCSHVLAVPLFLLFNKSISSSRVPLAWKESKVIPIYKKGPQSVPLNYRPISFTSVVCKVLKKSIVAELFVFF